MKSQKSFSAEQATLHLVATPIGNLEDITFRAVRLLKEADVIAAEDTRNTKKLCNHFAIQTPLISYHEHNQEAGGEKILAYLREGKTVALVSDAGMPCISDPGTAIAAQAAAAGYPVVPVPGANAALSALIASGLSSDAFLFYGFLPRHKKDRRQALEKLSQREETVLFYEAPHRLKDTLQALKESCGSDRRIVLARELTKKFEEFLRGTIGEAAAWAAENEIRGEFCIVLEGGSGTEAAADESNWWKLLTVEEHVEEIIRQRGLLPKDAVKEAAKERGVPKREVYQIYHQQ
ncbi:16S rRNA (cytidine(1402)-2'-O)-methyltransferase [Planococcus lenghuensis]|uniref:Ribosomal RNA small subunit methyltransferase I n=1 Tax=Planococcus lenghuensis TaxID=2213202 RepID=A0A1Q2KU18_9BACL|nr:16S rRNA (cytidine(1402)-2'-O)-methyltransferase [Planococcus lenghuensis]AQQ51705.1 16S rRNA (cytidine(1402)-2'-O)-methyltransferase [Planococcus lenghuensis]